MSGTVRVLVTGAAGLLGRRIVEAYVRSGADVTGVDIVEARGTPAARHVLTDLARDDLRMLCGDRYEVVVHAAAIPDLGRGVAEPDVFANNASATARLLFAALEAGTRRIAFVSSQSVLGLSRGPGVMAPDRLPIDEEHACRPRDGYALSKKLGEDLAGVLADRFDAAISSIRLPVVWDPAGREAHVARRLADPEQAARSNWAYVDSRDAARGILLATAREAGTHRVYNISAGRAFCRRPLADLVDDAYGPVPCGIDLRHSPSIFTSARAEAELGYRARFIWTETEIVDTHAL
ncbi:MAG: NAD(P)-dependent oxidoreductase [Microvirga sp.]